MDLLSLLPAHLLHRLLPFLGVQDLGRLAVCCRKLRQTVAAAPETAWLAAARTSFSLAHPVFADPGTVQDFLRRQQSIDAAIARGDTAVQTLSLPEGALAPNLAKHATLEAGSLSVLEVLPDSGETAAVSSQQLPLQPYCPASQWRWCANSRLLAIPYGAPEGFGPGGDGYPIYGAAGILIINTAAGSSCTPVEVDLGEQSLDVLELAGWGPTDLLLVRHGFESNDQTNVHFSWSCYNAAAEQVHTVACPGESELHAGGCLADARERSFAPDGSCVLVWDREWAAAWVWHLASGKLSHLLLSNAPVDDEEDREDDVQATQEMLWSPCSTMVLAVLLTGQALFFDTAGRLLSSCSMVSKGKSLQLACWGPAGVVALCSSRRLCSCELTSLVSHRVELGERGLDGQPCPKITYMSTHSIIPSLFHFARPLLSPDGCHVALCAYTPQRSELSEQDDSFRDCLKVFSFKTGQVQTYELAAWPGDTAAQADFEACWLPVSGAVLAVANFAGTMVQQLRFA